jgi:hypothetical protein
MEAAYEATIRGHMEATRTRAVRETTKRQHATVLAKEEVLREKRKRQESLGKCKQKRACDVSTREVDKLSDYEMQREVNIARNQAMLRSLGLEE